VIAASAVLAACASGPALRTDVIPPSTLVTAHDAGITDLRGAYRAAVCSRLAADETACDGVLLRLAGEPPTPTLPSAEYLAQKYRIAFVPGLFSECFEQFARPFADVQRDLREDGFTADYFQVSGRGTASQNAARLAEHFLTADGDPRPIIVFAYSKGLVDVLESVVQYPQTARKIAAVVAVAGAANGTPLADDVHATYRDWGADFPLPGCDKGTGAEVNDLRRDVRMAWWQQHGDAVTIPIFALVAAPRPDRVSPATRPTYRWLARIDPRNDGKLLWHDQIPARSYLLGYVNADHWSIATPVTQELPAFWFLFRDETPRTALVESAIEMVDHTLSDRASK
jgi:hypothetical protein